jgi:serine/threonine-protein kinase
VLNKTLQERYEVRRTIKRGGMGAVHEAWDLHLETSCAIKEMLCEVDDLASAQARFEREAKLLARLSHPGLPRVHDYFVEDGRAWLVMDYVEGEDLDSILAVVKRLDAEDVLAITHQILEVLKYLHEQSVVYKDLKPSNIMRRSDGRVFLVDFGIATTVREPDPKNTAIGTHGYAPPEQFLGKAEARSDIYSLGATMHHLLSGQAPQVPFHFAPLRQLRPELSLGLEAIVSRAVAYDAAHRFASAEFMLNALLRQESARATRRPVGKSAAAPPVATAWAPSSGSAAWGSPQPSWGTAPLTWGVSSGGSSPARPEAATRGGRSGAEYQCARCRRKVYSFSGLTLQCNACTGPMVQLGSA